VRASVRSYRVAYTPRVSDLLTHAVTAAATWLVGAAALFWAWLPGRGRRALALAVSLAGLVCLVLAVNSEGLHEASATAVFIVGAPYVTQQTSALTSLPYYILTGVCLLLGTAALVAGDDAARSLGERWMTTALVLSSAVSLLRFALEKVAAPEALTEAFGITWLAPVVGAYFFVALRSSGRGWGALAAALALYGVASRGFVAALYLVATTFHLGSHYDLSTVWTVPTPWGQAYHFVPGTLGQFERIVLLPQLALWPAFTVATGLVGAGVLRFVRESRKPPTTSASPRVEVRLAPTPEP
jgi:hypothetical protein